jgi:hypothetical protein
MIDFSPLCADILDELKNHVKTLERLTELSMLVRDMKADGKLTDEEFSAIVAAGTNCREALNTGTPW